eukprot:m.90684 g.90684  ORF g.90684 m.90684 type:complete len:606 (+) comp13277_c0_seq3:456-2273(+)
MTKPLSQSFMDTALGPESYKGIPCHTRLYKHNIIFLENVLQLASKEENRDVFSEDEESDDNADEDEDTDDQLFSNHKDENEDQDNLDFTLTEETAAMEARAAMHERGMSGEERIQSWLSSSKSLGDGDAPLSNDYNEAMSAAAEVSEEIDMAEDAASLFGCPVNKMDQSAFTAVVLSMWDNVSGPVNKRVWIGRGLNISSSFHQKLLPFIPQCTLNSEVGCETVGLESALYKFFVLTEIGYIMASFIFTTPLDSSSGAGGSLYVISLVQQLEMIDKYLPISTLCIARMRSLIKKLQAMLKKVGSLTPAVQDEFTELLRPFLTDMSTMGISLTPGMELTGTAFSPGNETLFDIHFLRKAVTSHLQTGGVTVVLGHDSTLIDIMIRTLALFLTNDERQQSRFALKNIEYTAYAPDLFLQGLILQKGDVDIDPELIIQSESPSSVISLIDQSVRQTKERNEYMVLHDQSKTDELLRLEGLEISDSKTSQKQLLHSIQDKSIMVKELLDLVFKPHTRHNRKALLTHFYGGLYRKAHVIVQYVKHLGASVNNPMTDEHIRLMRRDLELNCQQDFEIMLAFSEKLRKGMFTSLLGDPLAKEEQMLGLLGAF